MENVACQKTSKTRPTSQENLSPQSEGKFLTCTIVDFPKRTSRDLQVSTRTVIPFSSVDVAE